jgi:hypothetical protein
VPVDLFSLVVAPAVASAVGWGVTKTLNAVARCFCGSTEARSIQNAGFNTQSCSSCRRSLDQFTNATPHTVGITAPGSVAAAHISNIQWPAWNDRFHIYFDLDVIDSRYQDVVVQVSLSRFRGALFAQHEAPYRPIHPHTRWQQQCYSFERWSQFPTDPGVFAIDLRCYNLWGEQLFETRALCQNPGTYK